VESTAVRNGATRRPGGRTAEVTARINRACLELVVEGGASACTFGTVAERAGVERSTLYRRYSDEWEMMLGALIAHAGDDIVPDMSGSLAADLKSVASKLVAQLESPLGPAVVGTAAELRAHSGQDYSRTFFDHRMAQLKPMFDAAIARGELPPETDTEEMFSMVAGPIYFRLFIAARPIDEAWIDRLGESVCWLFCR
jgi:AcrR family transcriptional regulator